MVFQEFLTEEFPRCLEGLLTVNLVYTGVSKILLSLLLLANVIEKGNFLIVVLDVA
jgi:hypothetical protein